MTQQPVNPDLYNPGSFNQFTAIRKYSSQEEALGAYSIALDEYRQALAAEQGITVEDLHDGPFDYAEKVV